MSVKLTERAAEEVKRVMEEQNMNTDEYHLRVSVVGGGCSGFSYSLGFEEKKDADDLNDTIVEQHEIQVRVDRKSELYLDGTEVDFLTSLDKRGFVFNNPNATGGCGCGSSFSC